MVNPLFLTLCKKCDIIYLQFNDILKNFLGGIN